MGYNPGCNNQLNVIKYQFQLSNIVCRCQMNVFCVERFCLYIRIYGIQWWIMEVFSVLCSSGILTALGEYIGGVYIGLCNIVQNSDILPWCRNPWNVIKYQFQHSNIVQITVLKMYRIIRMSYIAACRSLDVVDPSVVFFCRLITFLVSTENTCWCHKSNMLLGTTEHLPIIIEMNGGGSYNVNTVRRSQSYHIVYADQCNGGSQ